MSETGSASPNLCFTDAASQEHRRHVSYVDITAKCLIDRLELGVCSLCSGVSDSYDVSVRYDVLPP